VGSKTEGRIRDIQLHREVDAIELNTIVTPVFRVGSYLVSPCSTCIRAQVLSMSKGRRQETGDGATDREARERETATYSGIPEYARCLTLAIKYWTSLSHVRRPIIPWQIANGSNILLIRPNLASNFTFRDEGGIDHTISN
jgi:hypothetical protein